MKILKFILVLGLLLNINLYCDESKLFLQGNQGQVIIKDNNGKSFLYTSNKKFYNGKITVTNPILGNMKVVEYTAKNGLPNKELKIYEYNINKMKNCLVIEGNGELKKDIFKGSIKIYDLNGNIVKDTNGEINLNTDTIINYSALRYFKYSIKKGTIKYWYENGKTKQISEYKDGNLHGKMTVYFENGKIQQISDYKNGHLHGKTMVYFENGNIRFKRKYHKGSLIENEEYYINGDLAGQQKKGFLYRVLVSISHFLYSLLK